MQVQFNILSADDLREAQRHPEAYRNLVVKVAGDSAPSQCPQGTPGPAPSPGRPTIWDRAAALTPLASGSRRSPDEKGAEHGRAGNHGRDWCGGSTWRILRPTCGRQQPSTAPCGAEHRRGRGVERRRARGLPALMRVLRGELHRASRSPRQVRSVPVLRLRLAFTPGRHGMSESDALTPGGHRGRVAGDPPAAALDPGRPGPRGRRRRTPSYGRRRRPPGLA